VTQGAKCKTTKCLEKKEWQNLLGFRLGHALSDIMTKHKKQKTNR
jgi:hypothetical protein